MARQDNDNAQLIHHYTHVVCALNETHKGSPTGFDVDGSAAHALEQTIKGVCKLIDVLVTAEHRERTETNMRASS